MIEAHPRQVNGIGVRADWAYLLIAGLGLATFVLLFQPWLAASGPNGKVSSNAFGEIEGITGNNGLVGSFTGVGGDLDGSGGLVISGVWAVLACCAAFATVCSAVMYLRVRSETLSRATVCSSAALAVFIVAELLYLNGKTPDLRAMTISGHNLGTSLGGIIRMFTGHGEESAPAVEQRVANAGLSLEAMLGGATALGAALCAAAVGLRNFSGTDRGVLPSHTFTAVHAAPGELVRVGAPR